MSPHHYCQALLSACCYIPFSHNSHIQSIRSFPSFLKIFLFIIISCGSHCSAIQTPTHLQTLRLQGCLARTSENTIEGYVRLWNRAGQLIDNSPPCQKKWCFACPINLLLSCYSPCLLLLKYYIKLYNPVARLLLGFKSTIAGHSWLILSL